MLRSQLTINYFANAKSLNLISVLHQYEISRYDCKYTGLFHYIGPGLWMCLHALCLNVSFSATLRFDNADL